VITDTRDAPLIEIGTVYGPDPTRNSVPGGVTTIWATAPAADGGSVCGCAAGGAAGGSVKGGSVKGGVAGGWAAGGCAAGGATAGGVTAGGGVIVGTGDTGAPGGKPGLGCAVAGAVG
jgi:hypothetical protein